MFRGGPARSLPSAASSASRSSPVRSRPARFSSLPPAKPCQDSPCPRRPTSIRSLIVTRSRAGPIQGTDALSVQTARLLPAPPHPRDPGWLAHIHGGPRNQMPLRGWTSVFSGHGASVSPAPSDGAESLSRPGRRPSSHCGLAQVDRANALITDLRSALEICGREIDRWVP